MAQLMSTEIVTLELSESTTDAIDLVAEALHEYLYANGQDKPQYILLDIRRCDLDALRHIILHMREILGMYNTGIQSCFALVINHNIIPDIADALLKTMAQRHCLYHFAHVQKAEQWLNLEMAKYQRKQAQR